MRIVAIISAYPVPRGSGLYSLSSIVSGLRSPESHISRKIGEQSSTQCCDTTSGSSHIFFAIFLISDIWRTFSGIHGKSFSIYFIVHAMIAPITVTSIIPHMEYMIVFARRKLCIFISTSRILVSKLANLQSIIPERVFRSSENVFIVSTTFCVLILFRMSVSLS